MAPTDPSKRILVLEPFGDGSHAAFYRGWQAQSRHHFTTLALPGVHWKWRSRHSSLTLAIQAHALVENGSAFDIVFGSEMLNLAEWRGFAPSLTRLPAIVYFHENQFTYPLADGQQRDYHFAYDNILTAIAADQVWFNSKFHLQEFTSAATIWLRRLPDFRHIDLFERAMAAAQVCPPGISMESATHHGLPNLRSGVLTIGWVARWEHDKRPDRFERVVAELVARELPFQLILLGQQFKQPHSSFDAIQAIAGDRILHAGFADDQATYWELLRKMDVIVSTADHEFFGIGIVEAVAAGAMPLLPKRLAYPEVFQLDDYHEREAYFYDGDEVDLLQRLTQLISQYQLGLTSTLGAQERARDFCWSKLAPKYDAFVDELAVRVPGLSRI
jgi:glycosyltransferase involved in cell wall biosynthesis